MWACIPPICCTFAGYPEEVGELVCVGQGQNQQAAQGLPSLCPPTEDGIGEAALEEPSQQPKAAAELVDGYQLHITGDAMDAIQSPVCTGAQVCMSSLITSLVPR